MLKYAAVAGAATGPMGGIFQFPRYCCDAGAAGVGAAAVAPSATTVAAIAVGSNTATVGPLPTTTITSIVTNAISVAIANVTDTTQEMLLLSLT